uniref:PilN domain-containing protein n=1 Tax=Dialister succinatiphilus TaxID=487173 RepID=UPI004038D6D8
MTENAVADAFRALAEQGMKRKEILLLVNFPDLRLENRKYPAMTEEEMVETMYWEEDRLFRTDEPMALGWEVTSHSPLGWEVHVEAVKKETLSLWEKGAALAGCHVGKALPVTAVPLSEEPHFILYGRKRSAILIFRKDRLLRSRILQREEKGKGALFMERCLANFNIQKGTCFFLPLSDCGREEETFWKERMKEEIEREGENGLLPGSLTMAENFLSDYGGWADMEILFRRLSSGRLTLPLTEKRKSFITEENRTLRAAQGLCLVSLLFFLLAGGEFLSAENRLSALRREEGRLKPQKEQLVEARRTAVRERELEQLLGDLEKKDGRWEEKLVLLAESVPPGIVISSIRQKGDVIHIEGTAQSNERLSLFRNSFSTSWGMAARNGSRRADPVTGLVDFTISLKGGNHGPDETHE